MAQASLNKLCLARRSAGGTPAECLASQKAGHFPCGKSLVPPPAPLSSFWLYYGSKNGIEKIFGLSEQPQNSVRTSLVPLSICLCKVRTCGASSTLRCKRCGVNVGASWAPPPTKLLEAFAETF